MRRVLVTGANKGVGFAIAEHILAHADDTFVFLGARDQARGDAAARRLLSEPTHSGRVQVVRIDVSSDASVDRAAAEIRESCGVDGLYGVVNNAGIGSGDLVDVLNVNTRGPHRVCSAMIPLLADGCRVVNLTSASGPNFVAECSAERQRFFTNPDVTWREIDALMHACVDIAGDPDAFAARGLSDGSPYGLSKACANATTMHLARTHPRLIINACTPGFIATDLTRQLESPHGQTVEEMGAKPPTEGTKSTLFLLFGQPEGVGHYYGSDAKRSPLDRYRSPGTPPYTGR